MRRLRLPLAALTILVTACATAAPPTATPPTAAPPTQPPANPSEPGDPTEPASPQPSTPSSQAPADPATAAPFAADTRPDTAEGRGDLVTLSDIRVARHATFDRVVLDVSGDGHAGWRVAYVDRAIADGSGDPVEVAGRRVLEVQLTHTGLPDDTGVAFYDGPKRLAGGDAVEEVVLIGMFEGTTQLFLGVDDERPFRVYELEGRVVIDVVHSTGAA